MTYSQNDVIVPMLVVCLWKICFTSVYQILKIVVTTYFTFTQSGSQLFCEQYFGSMFSSKWKPVIRMLPCHAFIPIESGRRGSNMAVLYRYLRLVSVRFQKMHWAVYMCLGADVFWISCSKLCLVETETVIH